MYALGVFPRFWFWTFTYAHKYASEISFSEGLQKFWIKTNAMNLWGWLWE